MWAIGAQNAHSKKHNTQMIRKNEHALGSAASLVEEIDEIAEM
jgi:hypothetical protein